MITLSFDKGTLLVEGLADKDPGPLEGLVTWDPRVKKFRAEALDYAAIVRALHGKHEFKDLAKTWEPVDFGEPKIPPPRKHQEESIAAWKAQGRRGTVVLPTGAGKSLVAFLAIAMTKRPTLVMVPTIDLMHQWQRQLQEVFGREVGALGGGFKDRRELTVATYDSAALMMEQMGNYFGLLVFDECHHLPSPRTRLAATMSLAPFRLGLTATPERSDGGHELLNRFAGPLAFRLEIDQISGSILSPYRTIRLIAPLDDDEMERYTNCRARYLEFIRDNGISFSNSNGWGQFIALCARRPEGREVFQAWLEQRRIARGGRGKMRQLLTIFQEHRGDRIIIFTADNDTAYAIGRAFLVPVLTHHTRPGERKTMLEKFRSGEWPVLATSKVLNEGVDVPEASVGIVVSGSGSTREHVQRLGRILRRAEGKQATLYELVSENTAEWWTSERRREHSAYRK